MDSDWHDWYGKRSTIYATFVGTIHGTVDGLRAGYIDSVRAVQMIDAALATCTAALEATVPASRS